MSRYSALAVTWKRYSTLGELVAAYESGGEVLEFKDIDTGSRQDATTERFVETLTKIGSWAYVFVDEDNSVPPIVHYWHDGERSQEHLAFLLGHELGHAMLCFLSVSLEKGPSFDDDPYLYEERVADTYGKVAATVASYLRGGDF